MKTTPGVFIIESVGPDDEKDGTQEGSALRAMLKLTGRKEKYRNVRNVQGLRDALRQFKDSGFRYLHISCHGDKDGSALWLRSDPVPFGQFGQIVGPFLAHRRLFISACKGVSKELADPVFDLSSRKCNSVVGFKHSERWDIAALCWASFYCMADEETIMRDDLRSLLRRIGKLYRVQFRAYFPDVAKGENLPVWPKLVVKI